MCDPRAMCPELKGSVTIESSSQLSPTPYGYYTGDFHAFTAADRFNYNGPSFNYLRTPNERTNLFASVRHDATADVQLFATLSYTQRSSATRAAPEPLCLGAGCGNRINDEFMISARNPYNPFNIDLSVAEGTLEFFGRRPLESGNRLFFSTTNKRDTHHFKKNYRCPSATKRGGRPLLSFQLFSLLTVKYVIYNYIR